jgi:hypothetical protein
MHGQTRTTDEFSIHGRAKSFYEPSSNGTENLNQELRGNTTGVHEVQISESDRNSFRSLEKRGDTFFVPEG